MIGVRALSRISMVSADSAKLAGFYRSTFGFRPVGGAARRDVRMRLRLGEQEIELWTPSPPGAPYPPDVPAWSPYFQHVAIVVSDMARAYVRLRAVGGWSAISTDGPSRLPSASGGVTAFKFRDPEGHPLELLAFERGREPEYWRARRGAAEFLGMDHSAISVADTARSAAFYGALGMRRTGGSLNVGVEQERLDGVERAIVEVTALSPPARGAPHLELLCYRGAPGRPAPPLAANDVAATRLVFEGETEKKARTPVTNHGRAEINRPRRMSGDALQDPDGHFFTIETGRREG